MIIYSLKKGEHDWQSLQIIAITHLQIELKLKTYKCDDKQHTLVKTDLFQNREYCMLAFLCVVNV